MGEEMTIRTSEASFSEETAPSAETVIEATGKGQILTCPYSKADGEDVMFWSKKEYD